MVSVELTDNKLSQGVQIYSAANDELPIVIDTGASTTLTPNASDFIGAIRPSPKTQVKGLTSTTTVAGTGAVQWTIRDALFLFKKS